MTPEILNENWKKDTTYTNLTLPQTDTELIK